MKLSISSNKENPLLERNEIIIRIESEKTPSKDELKKSIIEELKLTENPELIVIKKINTSFGTKVCEADVLIYKNEQIKKRIEVIPRKIRRKMQEEKK